MVVPDLACIVRRYLDARNRGCAEAGNLFMQELRTHPPQREKGVLGLYRRLTAFHHHKWMYDEGSLVTLCRKAGFTEVESKAALDSRIERIAQVEDPCRILNGEGIAVEGVKQSG